MILIENVFLSMTCVLSPGAQTVAMPAPLSPREMVRTEVTRQILEVARRHVASDGAAALSVRSVARDLGMAPSALYRYFPSRDALLSALILGAYEALATAAEEASDAAERPRPTTSPASPPSPGHAGLGARPPP